MIGGSKPGRAMGSARIKCPYCGKGNRAGIRSAAMKVLEGRVLKIWVNLRQEISENMISGFNFVVNFLE